MSNVAVFRNYLKEVNLHMEEVQEENGSTFFRTKESFDNGGSVIIVIIFNDKQNLVDLRFFDIASVTNPLKKEALHSLLNELNASYRFIKFIEFEGDVAADYSYAIKPNELDPVLLMDIVLMLLRIIKDSYPRFMKLQWT